MEITQLIRTEVSKAVKALYDYSVDEPDVLLNPTRKEIEGDYTVVVFPFTKAAKKAPPVIAEELGNYLTEHVEDISGYTTIKGFLNLNVNDAYWSKFLSDIATQENYGYHTSNGRKVVVEFSSPNTNKPLHLGHVRNILLGWSMSRIFEASGYDTKRVQIINDRGIHICKSMVAWQKFGEGRTPESMSRKGDHLVGEYYVMYNNEEKEQRAALEAADNGDDEPAILQEARELLLKWEDNDSDTRELWKTMNGWVYTGFDETYKNLGVNFDKIYYESETYLLGKDTIEKGLEKNIFYKKDDGSVWIDLEDAKLDHKLVLRSDGTSVYITQDIGTAEERYRDYEMEKSIYVVGNEQDYHFKVLFEILKRLEEPYAEGLYHLSYGMVELPEGKMKSREGTVVDADDLMTEVVQVAKEESLERGDVGSLSEERQQEIWRRIGMAALKYHIIRVTPRKKILFDPKESVDIQGQSGPFVQYAYVRTHSVLNKAGEWNADMTNYTTAQPQEKELLMLIRKYGDVIADAAKNYDPSLVANYVYDLAKSFNKFYHDIPILKAESEAAKGFRLTLTQTVGKVLTSALDLLGIEVPERM